MNRLQKGIQCGMLRGGNDSRRISGHRRGTARGKAERAASRRLERKVKRKVHSLLRGTLAPFGCFRRLRRRSVPLRSLRYPWISAVISFFIKKCQNISAGEGIPVRGYASGGAVFQTGNVSVIGSVTVKQVPPPGLSATVRVPLWRVVSSLAMLSPSPKCALPLRALSTR